MSLKTYIFGIFNALANSGLLLDSDHVFLLLPLGLLSLGTLVEVEVVFIFPESLESSLAEAYEVCSGVHW